MTQRWLRSPDNGVVLHDPAVNALSTRAPFVEAMRQIKKAQGIRLSQPTTAAQRAAFLTDALRHPDIVTHLTRGYENLTVAAGVPQLALPAPSQAKDKAAKRASDYHEVKFYELLGEMQYVPFRGDMQAAFTTQGANPAEFECLFKELAAQAAPLRQVVTRPLKGVDLRLLVSALAFTQLPLEQQPRFAMTPIWESRHAMAVVSIYEPTTRTPMASVLINSVPDHMRFLAIATAFYGHADEPELPMVHAPHALQMSLRDYNCTVYSYNILRGMSAMLGDESVALRVLALATRLNGRDVSAVEPLQGIFMDELKAYLPQYYDAGGRVHPQDVLDAYNARARWELGARSIALFADELRGPVP